MYWLQISAKKLALKFLILISLNGCVFTINHSQEAACYAFEDSPKLTEEERDLTPQKVNEFLFNYQSERDFRCNKKKWYEFE